MNKIFNRVSVEGVIEPGQVYIFDRCSNRGFSPEPFEYLYCIKEEKEILQALDMDYSIVLAEDYQLIEFLGFRKINRNCHEFNLLVYEKETGEKVKRSLYLHRILPFDEFLDRTKRQFRE